jgi:phage terminase large subunit-like protein
MFIQPTDNAENLTQDYLDSLKMLPKRQRDRFFYGKYVDEYDNALWTYEAIERCRRPVPEEENIRRVVVAVDASGASGREDLAADEIGIVVMALGVDGHGYVLADRSCRESPTVWGRRVVDAYEEFGADAVVAEKNFGGEMVRFVIQSAVAHTRNERGVPAVKNISVRMVTASRGKVVRAEPVSALYGDDVAPPRIHHCDSFVQLEDQLCGFTTTGYMGDESPDRADALVWAATELMLGYQAVNVGPIIVTAPHAVGYEG